jgi:ABC-type antimicrobial peptide transport system permease subunit
MVGSAMAILLACMGLFALTTLIITHRTKEIGVRKVLGASEWSIVRLLVSDFTRLVGIAIGVALPLAWYAMDHWIKDYMYRITLSPLLFTVGGVVALVIAIMTISVQALRAARINPVRALKTE